MDPSRRFRCLLCKCFQERSFDHCWCCWRCLILAHPISESSSCEHRTHVGNNCRGHRTPCNVGHATTAQFPRLVGTSKHRPGFLRQHLPARKTCRPLEDLVTLVRGHDRREMVVISCISEYTVEEFYKIQSSWNIRQAATVYG